MPNCFQLFEKDSDQKEAISLNRIDEEICQILKVPVHPKKYGGGYIEGGFNWFDTIGYMIATDSEMFLSSEKLRKHYLESEMWEEEKETIKKILDYLESKYVSTSFYSV